MILLVSPVAAARYGRRVRIKPQDNRFIRPTATQAFEAAAEVLFDERIAGDFVSYRVQSEDQSSTFPDGAAWARSMARALKSGEFIAFLDEAIAHGREALAATLPHVPRDRFVPGRDDRRAGLEHLECLHAALVADSDDPAWVAVLAVALGRLIATQASGGFPAERWSERDRNWLELDQAFTNAAAGPFARLVLQGPIPREELARLAGAIAPDALGLVAALVPEGKLMAMARPEPAADPAG